MKYDVVSTEVDESRVADLRTALGLAETERLWIGACTWPGEEAICLETHRRLLQEFPGLRLLLAPRHVERAESVQQEIEKAGFACFRRSTAPAPHETGAILLLDTVGELSGAYALAQCTFVGKSLTSQGGHNVMEPAALGVPPVFGPHTENFVAETRVLLEDEAAVLVQNSDDMYNAILRFLRNDELRHRMGEAGRRAVLARRGATQRHLEALTEALEGGPAQ
jgi:3-deoxy-D-manno-octulosonic-acid transferase